MSSYKLLSFHLKKCFYNSRRSQKYIFDHYYIFARTLCEPYAANYEELTSLINGCFLLAFKNIPLDCSREMPTEILFRKWLRKWIMCAIIDHCRKNFQHQHLLHFKHEPLNNPSLSWNRFLHNVCPALQKKSADAINWIIQSLNPSDRIILNLLVLENFNNTDVANSLGIPLITAQANTTKAIEQIKKSARHFKMLNNA